MTNFNMTIKYYDKSVEINHYPNCLYLLGHTYKNLINDGSASGKTNSLLNLIQHQLPDINKTYLYVKNSFESKYLLLINGRKKVDIKKLKNPNAFINYSQTMSMKI